MAALFFASFYNQSVAAPFITPSPLADSGEAIGPSIELLITSDNTLKASDILSPEISSLFTPLHKESFNPGFFTPLYWARFSIKNNADFSSDYLLEIDSPLIDTVILYTITNDEIIKKEVAGEKVPFGQREFKHRKPLFHLTIPANQEYTFLIKIEDIGSASFKPVLWEKDRFYYHSQKEFILLGIYYGAIVIILFYNLVLYLMIRSINYLYYVFYVGNFIIWQFTFNGLASQFLWPESVWLNHYAITFFISTSGITALLFSRRFLSTAVNIPQFDKIIRLVIGGFLIGLLFSIFPSHLISKIVVAFMAVLFSPTVLIASILCLQRGYRPARYFVIAWFTLICGTLLLGLKSFGLLPSTFITEYGQQLGSFIEILLLSLALADQVNLIKKEKEEAQEKALELQKSINVQLEDKVNERTTALQKSNRNLKNLSAKLSKYLSPQVYQSIFSGQTDVVQQTYRKQLTVFFSDIKGFTELTDSTEPETLNNILNYYLNQMTEIALRHGGTIDKFIGDAIMIFFGDPETKGEKEDALACAKMAIEMRELMNSLSAFGPIGEMKSLQIRIGINTGFCTVGNFGSENRLDYTIIGGQVNLASRLESSAQPNQILISNTTYELIKDEICCHHMGEIKVKGIAYPVKIYQVDHIIDQQDTAWQMVMSGDGYNVAIDPRKMVGKDKISLTNSLLEAIKMLRENE